MPQPPSGASELRESLLESNEELAEWSDVADLRE
jgi:hypothetical protein